MLSDVAHIETLNVVFSVLILPVVYFQDCVEVHREFARFYRDIAKLQDGLPAKIIYEFKNALHIFNLEHWYVMAVAVLLSSVFVGADSLSASKYLTSPSDFESAKKIVLSGGIIFSGFLIYMVKHAKRKAHFVMTEYCEKMLWTKSSNQ